MTLETETAVETTETAAQPDAEVPAEVAEVQESDSLGEFRPSVITVQNGRSDVCLFKLTRRKKADVEQDTIEIGEEEVLEQMTSEETI